MLKAPLPANSVTSAAINDKAVTAEKIDFTTLNFGNYSLAEKDTGFKWVDGSVIYKKTISLGAGRSDQLEKVVAHGIANIKYILKLEGFSYNPTGDPRFYPVSVTTSPGSYTVIGKILADNTNIRWQCSYGTASNETAWATLYYSKN